MEKQQSQGRLFLKRLIDPKAIIFGFAILHFLAALMYLIGYQERFPGVSTHWSPVKLMFEPVLLLLAAASLLTGKGWGYLIAIVASGRVIYALGYLGLIAISVAHDHPLVSWYVLRTWLAITYAAQPQYLLELAIAAAIVVYASVLCSFRILASRRIRTN